MSCNLQDCEYMRERKKLYYLASALCETYTQRFNVPMNINFVCVARVREREKERLHQLLQDCAKTANPWSVISEREREVAREKEIFLTERLGAKKFIHFRTSGNTWDVGSHPSVPPTAGGGAVVSLRRATRLNVERHYAAWPDAKIFLLTIWPFTTM